MNQYKGVTLTINTDKEPVDFCFKTQKIGLWCRDLKKRLKACCPGLKVVINIQDCIDCSVDVIPKEYQIELEEILENLSISLYNEIVDTPVQLIGVKPL